jgi:hypothetical protein
MYQVCRISLPTRSISNIGIYAFTVPCISKISKAMFHHLQPLIRSVSKNQVVAVVTSATLMAPPYVCYGLWNIATVRLFAQLVLGDGMLSFIYKHTILMSLVIGLPQINICFRLAISCGRVFMAVLPTARFHMRVKILLFLI